MDEDLSERFREACNKKFGDKQGKIKQGYILAITNFINEVMETPQDVVEDSTSTPEPPTLSAKKLEVASRVKPSPPPSPRENVPQEMLEHEADASTQLDQDEDSIEAKAKKLAEERRKQNNSEHKVLS